MESKEDFSRIREFWDKPSVEPRQSIKLQSYLDESYTESYDLESPEDDKVGVIDEKKGESSNRIGILEDGELVLEENNNDDDGASNMDDDGRDHHVGGHGFTYSARLVPDDYFDKRHCLENGDLKGRRPMPQAFASDFLDNVVQNKDGKWVYSGELNGWPALTSLEVISMEYVYKTRGGVFSKTYWSAKKHGKKEKPYYPKAGLAFFLETPKSVRIKVREPSWSYVGFSKSSPGFLFWYSKGLDMDQARIAHGTNCVQAARAEGQRNVCVRAHHFSHRYSVGDRRETFKESVSYHTGVLLEWDHQKYCTVVELAWLGGLGGYGGKSNWYDDKDSGNPMLYDAMPACLKKPWRSNMSEIRVLDVEAKNLAEFKAFLKKHTGKRFTKPEINQSGPVRLTFCEEEHILQYCLNYIQRDQAYSEANRNCQTFAADFAGFLLAKNIKPTHSPMVYYDRRHLFLYDADMFDTKASAVIRQTRSPIQSSDSEAKRRSVATSLASKAKKKILGR